MKKIINFIILFFFFTIVSCKENRTLNENNIPYKKSLENKNISEFSEEKLTCTGEQYSASRCYNEIEKVSILFDKKKFKFSFGDKNFEYSDIENFADLGYEIHLYSNKSTKVILIDSFIENGRLPYVFLYNQSGMFFIGSKEIIINEETTSIKKINVYQENNEIIVSYSKNIENLRLKIENRIKLNTNSSVENLMMQNISSPEQVTDNLIFTKDANNQLQINTEILDYIQKTTTATENRYTLALEQYVSNEITKFFDEKKSIWTEEELIKIIAFASNTTDPLHKKYWKESPENWHDGMWGNILSYCYLVYYHPLWFDLQKQFKKENYYNLPYLKEMTSYATEFDKFGPP